MENNKSMKSVTLSFEKYGCLLNLPVNEAGEIIQTIITYGMTGNIPEIKDRYKAMFYQTFLDPITAQISASDKRAKQCREAAEARSAAIKEAKKIVAKQTREEKSAKKNEMFIDVRTTETTNPQTTVEGYSPIATLSNDTVANVNAPASSENLSYDYLISLGIKRDTGSFNGGLTWNSMSVDDKRAAIAYASRSINANGMKYNAQYASQFLKSKPWLNE